VAVVGHHVGEAIRTQQELIAVRELDVSTSTIGPSVTPPMVSVRSLGLTVGRFSDILQEST